jgi:NAD(P)H-hydrate epimerase
MEILNSSQMAQADAFTINEIGIPSIVLMENAAITVVDEILSRKPDAVTAAVVVGAGNNGGDGLAVARLLINSGFACDIFIACEESDIKGDALVNYNILKSYDAPIFFTDESDTPSFEGYDILVDALFGTGLSRPLDGFYLYLVQYMNLTSNYIVSVDIPSGLSGSTHNVIGECVDADLTVTFARPKYPHVMYPAREFCGEVVVTDISIPDFAVETVCASTFLLNESTLPYTPVRAADSHKGDFGHAVIAGGSEGKSGAVFMASRACARCGAGLTTVAVPGRLMPAAEAVNPEIMSMAAGSKSYFTADCADELAEYLKTKTVCAVGPGLGTNEETAEFLSRLISLTDLPLVIDADGINLLSEKDFNKLADRCILTPHIGEFSKMTGKPRTEVLKNRVELSREFAVSRNIILVLKSADTVIALPDGNVFVNISGTPALAKGGSGDCLTGLIASFVAQGYDLTEAACLGSYTLGRTAEIVSEEMNEKSVLTSDIIENIWKTLDELEENS